MSIVLREKQFVKLRNFYGKWNSKISFVENEKEKIYVKTRLMHVTNLIARTLYSNRKRVVKDLGGMISISSYIPTYIRRRIAYYDKGLKNNKRVFYNTTYNSFYHGTFDYVAVKSYQIIIYDGIDPKDAKEDFGIDIYGIKVRCKHNTEIWVVLL